MFQTFDKKLECVGFYCDGNLSFDMDQLPMVADTTWSYVPYLRDRNVNFVNLYLEGKELTDHLPEYLVDDWKDVHSKLKAHERCLAISQVDLDENCFYDLVPKNLLIEWALVKNNISQHIINTFPKPRRYEFYKRLAILVDDISHRSINLDQRLLKSLAPVQKNKNFIAGILRGNNTVQYNVFGTKTGRLTTQRNSFPILTLPKSIRGAILPSNDCFVELDFNGAEVRVLLGMLNKEQPPEDIHEFHRQHIFDNSYSRDEAKQCFFAWLYGSRDMIQSDAGKRLEKFYDKKTLLSDFWQNKMVKTPYGKIIGPSDHHHALNYLVQSTAAELALKQFLKIDYLLRTKSRKSHVAFLVHDAVVLDMSEDDLNLLTEVCALMGSTNFGTFPLNIKKGSTLGNMKRVL